MEHVLYNWNIQIVLTTQIIVTISFADNKIGLEYIIKSE